jgi:hypothetical protein
MRARSTRLLEERTGVDLATWTRRVAEHAAGDEAALRAWLVDQGVTGYAQSLLVMERFGYPDFLLASVDELLDGQYRDRAALRPVLDTLVALVTPLGGVAVQVRKTWVSLDSPRRQFALVRPTTRTRVDLGLRLPDVAPGGRLAEARGLGNDTINVRVGLHSTDEVDDEVAGWLAAAYAAANA